MEMDAPQVLIDADTPQPPFCWSCGRYMALIHGMPRLGGLPRCHTFQCSGCGDEQTFEEA